MGCHQVMRTNCLFQKSDRRGEEGLTRLSCVIEFTRQPHYCLIYGLLHALNVTILRAFQRPELHKYLFNSFIKSYSLIFHNSLHNGIQTICSKVGYPRNRRNRPK